jgi:hypothetical protein
MRPPEYGDPGLCMIRYGFFHSNLRISHSHQLYLKASHGHDVTRVVGRRKKKETPSKLV